MIPTMILVGLVAGRWWAIPLGGVAWAGLVFFDGDCDWLCAPIAFFAAAVNTSLGVAIHMGVRLAVRTLRRRG